MASNNDLAILRLDLAEIIPAYALNYIVGTLNDLYFGHLWLDLAEKSIDPGPFPDEYSPSEEENLYVNRLEIGTPNFLELLGLAGPLTEVLAYIGGVAGLVGTGKGAMTLVKDWYDIQDKRYGIQEKQLKIKELSRQLEGSGVQNRIEQHSVDLMRPESDLVTRARALYDHGRISSTAMEHKREMGHNIMEASYFLREFCSNPSLIVIETRK